MWERIDLPAWCHLIIDWCHFSHFSWLPFHMAIQLIGCLIYFTYSLPHFLSFPFSFRSSGLFIYSLLKILLLFSFKVLPSYCFDCKVFVFPSPFLFFSLFYCCMLKVNSSPPLLFGFFLSILRFDFWFWFFHFYFRICMIFCLIIVNQLKILTIPNYNFLFYYFVI